MTESGAKVEVEEFITKKASESTFNVVNDGNKQLNVANFKILDINKRSVQELVAERLKYTNILQTDPNNFEAHEALASIDEEVLFILKNYLNKIF